MLRFPGKPPSPSGLRYVNRTAAPWATDRLGLPHDAAEILQAAVQIVGRIVDLERILLAVQRESALGDAVGNATYQRSEPGGIPDIGFKLIKTQHHVSRLAGAIGDPELGDGGTVGDDPRDRTGGVRKSELIDAGAVVHLAKGRPLDGVSRLG